jgi:hypothetical protein
VEHRQNKRYQLTAPVNFSWEDVNGPGGKAEGHTRDISVSGIYVSTTDVPPEGSELRMEVLLPPAQGNGNRVRLRAEGSVVRSDSRGFAAIAEMNLSQKQNKNRLRDRSNFEAMLRLQMQN